MRIDIERGTHIYACRGFIKHHGIYINQKDVVHFDGGPGAKNPMIWSTSLKYFADGNDVLTVNHSDPMYNNREVIERARSQLGRRDYTLLDRNCEHFVTWCINGDAISDQVGEVFGLATRGGIALATLGVILAAPITVPIGLVIAAGTAASLVLPGVVEDAARRAPGFEN